MTPLEKLRKAATDMNLAMSEVTAHTEETLLKKEAADPRPVLEEQIKAQVVITASCVGAALINSKSNPSLWSDAQHETLDLLLLLRQRDLLNRTKV